ncbi:MAG: hypothetical protein IJF06_05110, partial [Bacteroidaceae bacterium]|nr:hypothetical protein [Bacteroidaceae bacterium]
MLAVNGHAKHRQSLCRVGYGKTALSMDLFFITTANILSTHTFLLLSQQKRKSGSYDKKVGEQKFAHRYAIYKYMIT